MNLKISLILLISALTFNSFAQGFQKLKSKVKHTTGAKTVSCSDDYFVTAGNSGDLYIWDYEGKILEKILLDNAKINSIEVIPDSKKWLVGITSFNPQRYIIKCFNTRGEELFELIDTTIDQIGIDQEYSDNNQSTKAAIKAVDKNFPGLRQKELESPKAINGLSHIELIQDIKVSPDGRSIVSIDKYNILKIWNSSGEIINSMKIQNGKKDTELYFLNSESLFISPAITLNINSVEFKNLEGFERYSGIPFSNFIYFYFDYNDFSRPEKMYNLTTTETIDLNKEKYYSYSAVTNGSYLVLLGQDRLIRVFDESGELNSEFGKDRKVKTTFRGEELTEYSSIKCFDIAPNSNFVVTGNEIGKITIWNRVDDHEP